MSNPKNTILPSEFPSKDNIILSAIFRLKYTIEKNPIFGNRLSV